MRIPIDQVIPDPNQPRKTFDDEAIKELANSFESYGIISPLKVRPCGDDQYMIITGELRYRAAKLQGDRDIEVGDPIEVTDQQAREMQFIENLQRKEIPAWELGQAFKEYCDTYRVSQTELARKIGCSLQALNDRIVLFTNASLHIMEALNKSKLQYWEAKEIARIPNHERQQEVAEPFIKGEVSSIHVGKVAEIARKEPERPVEDIIEEVITGKVREREAAQLEAAKSATGITIETPEGLMRGAEALKKEAERKAREAMTPEQKAEEERKKLVAEARKSLDSTAKKIDRAGKVMDVSKFRERLNNIEQTLEKETGEAKAQLTSLGQQVTEAENKAKAEAKAKQEEEKRQRQAEEERRRQERADRKAREKYKQDKAFIQEALKAMPEEEVAEMLNMVPIPDKVKKVKSVEQEFDEIMKMASKVVDNLDKLKREGKIEQLDLKRFSITLRILADCLDDFAKLAEGRFL